ncbi:MAG TPA: acireductone synthase [Sphingobium sp.]|uniref:acireductone synthase n=1 Tax=Sphingobium sp. TaxID=1912891 RepID=UPI002ED35C7A
MKPAAIVTDIEGTTSSIAFVHDVLFPYSRARLADFVMAHPREVEPILDAVRAEAGEALNEEGCIARLIEWHDADRKVGPLKQLQGLIWTEGYARRAFTGHVYADAAEGLRRWHAAGIPLYVYSSGSMAAQKLLFGWSDHGDLTPLFSGHFDTGIGGKREEGSYHAIAATLRLPPADILFLSDTPEELAAARAAGLAVTLLARDGAPVGSAYPVATSFDDIVQLEARS